MTINAAVVSPRRWCNVGEEVREVTRVLGEEPMKTEYALLGRFSMRGIPPELREQLLAAARDQDRTLNKEIVHRLRKSFEQQGEEGGRNG
jgi:predicted HicB family RNase H-like nuclease